MFSRQIQCGKRKWVGEKIEWKLRRVLSDREEGMSPEIEDYAALWFEADGLSGMREHQSFTVILGTDGNSYIEGQQAAIEILFP